MGEQNFRTGEHSEFAALRAMSLEERCPYDGPLGSASANVGTQVIATAEVAAATSATSCRKCCKSAIVTDTWVLQSSICLHISSGIQLSLSTVLILDHIIVLIITANRRALT